MAADAARRRLLLRSEWWGCLVNRLLKAVCTEWPLVLSLVLSYLPGHDCIPIIYDCVHGRRRSILHPHGAPIYVTKIAHATRHRQRSTQWMQWGCCWHARCHSIFLRLSFSLLNRGSLLVHVFRVFFYLQRIFGNVKLFVHSL